MKESEGRAPVLAGSWPTFQGDAGAAVPSWGVHPARSRGPRRRAHLAPHTAADPAPRAEREPCIHQADASPAPQEPARELGMLGIPL